MHSGQPKLAMFRATGLALGATVLLSTGWQPFKKPDPDVQQGNKLIRKGKPAKALVAYQKAEKRLGRRHRLDYNRGLALFGKGKLKKAKEAFLSATGGADQHLRKLAFYNLANTLFRLAEPTVKKAQTAATAVKNAEAAIAQFKDESQKQQRCKAMANAAKAFKAAQEANQAVKAAFTEARNEYRLVLLRDPKHFDAKWNMELCLRHMGGADAANGRLTARAKELADRFQKECKPPEDKKKKNKDKQNKDKQNKDKQNKDQQNKDKQNKDKQNKDKQNKDKQNKDKQNKDKQKPQNPKDPKQKPLSKEDIAKRKAAKQLEQLERKQRARDRRRDRSGTTRRPLKDW
jgi:Ca-activated chloride channel homolog